jgi:hypothetical protein
MGSTEPQHTPNWPAVPLKPFGRPCKIFVTQRAATYSLSASQTQQPETRNPLNRHYGACEPLDYARCGASLCWDVRSSEVSVAC